MLQGRGAGGAADQLCAPAVQTQPLSPLSRAWAVHAVRAAAAGCGTRAPAASSGASSDGRIGWHIARIVRFMRDATQAP